MNRVTLSAHLATYRAPVLYTLIVALLPMTGACQRPQGRTNQRSLTPEQQAKWTQDSARYLADSAKWVRDSIVRDSISRTINTDSLFRGMHRMLAAPDPAATLGQVECIHSQITWRYGSIPGLAAIQRLMDTVWKRDDSAAVARMYSKINNPTLAQQEQRAAYRCDRGRMQPNMLNGTSLDGMGGRPARPQRP